MSTTIFPVEKVIRGNTTKPREAEFAGRYHGDYPVYVEKEAVLKHVPLLDENQEPVYRVYAHGGRKARTVPVVDRLIEREYIIVDLGNGMTKKNYNFHPAEHDLIAARAQEEATPAEFLKFKDTVGRIFKKLGLSDEDLAELAGEDEAPAGAN